MKMIGEPDAGNPPVRFDEGMQETGGNVPRLRPTLQLQSAPLQMCPCETHHFCSRVVQCQNANKSGMRLLLQNLGFLQSGNCRTTTIHWNERAERSVQSIADTVLGF
jgi:hypothetical protein